jgi:oligopeptide transport system ATP-binding protein
MSEAIAKEKVTLDGHREQMVEVDGVKKYYPVKSGFLGRSTSYIRAVDDVSFNIPKGDTFSLVGESGCGKTTAGKSLLRIVEPTAGTVTVDGEDVTGLSKSALRRFRQKMQMVYQDPSSSLNPRQTVRDIIAEPMKIHDVGTKSERNKKVRELLDLVGLPPDSFVNRYPVSLSGGQKQRVGIARAVCLDPEFVVLDEPTSALDVSVQATIISLLEDLQEKLNLTYLFISHDLSLVKNFADWIGVMYLGQIVEIGRAETVFRNPQHPYTRALLSAIPTVTEADKELKPGKIVLDGDLPEPTEEISGCPFRTRCPWAFDDCEQRNPPLYRVDGDHHARCLLHDEEPTETVEWV